MFPGLAEKLQHTWYGPRRPGPALLGLEAVYRAGFSMARLVHRLRYATDLSAQPIVVVGNLTAGGTGKTPMVIRLCELALELDLRPGVASRGYGRTSKLPATVSAASAAAEVGDEPLLIARRCGVNVRVDANRERAVRCLFEHGSDLVICDDGLQRARLPRQVEVCIVDGKLGFGNGHLLPAGPLRESPERLESVDFVVEHAQGNASERAAFTMTLVPGDWQPVNGAEGVAGPDLSREAVAIAGIGDPVRFFSLLEEMGCRIQRHPFPDHHVYSASDFKPFQQRGPILMTEKDAVKCSGLGLENAWYLPVSAVFSDNLEIGLRDWMAGLKQELKEREPG